LAIIKEKQAEKSRLIGIEENLLILLESEKQNFENDQVTLEKLKIDFSNDNSFVLNSPLLSPMRKALSPLYNEYVDTNDDDLDNKILADIYKDASKIFDNEIVLEPEELINSEEVDIDTYTNEDSSGDSIAESISEEIYEHFYNSNSSQDDSHDDLYSRSDDYDEDQVYMDNLDDQNEEIGNNSNNNEEEEEEEEEEDEEEEDEEEEEIEEELEQIEDEIEENDSNFTEDYSDRSEAGFIEYIEISNDQESKNEYQNISIENYEVREDNEEKEDDKVESIEEESIAELDEDLYEEKSEISSNDRESLEKHNIVVLNTSNCSKNDASSDDNDYNLDEESLNESLDESLGSFKDEEREEAKDILINHFEIVDDKLVSVVTPATLFNNNLSIEEKSHPNNVENSYKSDNGSNSIEIEIDEESIDQEPIAELDEDLYVEKSEISSNDLENLSEHNIVTNELYESISCSNGINSIVCQTSLSDFSNNDVNLRLSFQIDDESPVDTSILDEVDISLVDSEDLIHDQDNEDLLSNDLNLDDSGGSQTVVWGSSFRQQESPSFHDTSPSNTPSIISEEILSQVDKGVISDNDLIEGSEGDIMEGVFEETSHPNNVENSYNCDNGYNSIEIEIDEESIEDESIAELDEDLFVEKSEILNESDNNELVIEHKDELGVENINDLKSKVESDDNYVEFVYKSNETIVEENVNMEEKLINNNADSNSIEIEIDEESIEEESIAELHEDLNEEKSEISSNDLENLSEHNKITNDLNVGDDMVKSQNSPKSIVLSRKNYDSKDVDNITDHIFNRLLIQVQDQVNDEKKEEIDVKIELTEPILDFYDDIVDEYVDDTFDDDSSVEKLANSDIYEDEGCLNDDYGDDGYDDLYEFDSFVPQSAEKKGVIVTTIPKSLTTTPIPFNWTFGVKHCLDEIFENSEIMENILDSLSNPICDVCYSNNPCYYYF
jgi:hypothetical protein